MKSHLELSDSDFEKQFENCSLDSAIFNHEAHLRLAWIHLKNYGLEQAIDNIKKQLQEYVYKLGATDKYNETLTVAAVKAVYHFMLKTEITDFNDFISENPQLKTNFKELMASHYSFDIFSSPKAKKVFLEPDLSPFD